MGVEDRPWYSTFASAMDAHRQRFLKLCQLSSRQREVAELVACGLSDEAIARVLFISPRTARGHVADVLLRLDASNRVEIACAVLVGMDSLRIDC